METTTVLGAIAKDPKFIEENRDVLYSLLWYIEFISDVTGKIAAKEEINSFDEIDEINLDKFSLHEIFFAKEQQKEREQINRKAKSINDPIDNRLSNSG